MHRDSNLLNYKIKYKKHLLKLNVLKCKVVQFVNWKYSFAFNYKINNIDVKSVDHKYKGFRIVFNTQLNLIKYIAAVCITIKAALFICHIKQKQKHYVVQLHDNMCSEINRSIVRRSPSK